MLCFGAFEKGTADFIKSYVSRIKDDILIDVGANIGLHTLIMRIALPCDSCARVISIEPNPDMQIRLHKNLALNNFDDVAVVGRGASSQRKTGELRLSCNENESRYHNPGLATSFNKINSKRSINIELCKVDDMVEELGLHCRDVKLIQIDIEGAEFDSLLGMKKILSEGGPAIIIEYNVSGYDECSVFLESFGYTVIGALIRFGVDNNLRSENILFLKISKNATSCVDV